jgi:hypothetical protein
MVTGWLTYSPPMPSSGAIWLHTLSTGNALRISGMLGKGAVRLQPVMAERCRCASWAACGSRGLGTAPPLVTYALLHASTLSRCPQPDA